MAEFPAIPLWTDALLADTGHLDHDEFGLYMRLLIVMWRSPECRVPNDPTWIAKRLRLAPLEYASKVLPIVEEFCITDGNYISQKRLLKEFHYVRKMSKDQSARALKKWMKIREQKEAAKTTVSDNPLEQLDLGICPSDAPTPTPTPTDISKDISPLIPPKDDGGEDWFEERFWKPYPKQRAGSKDAARKAMTKALTKTTKEEIENAVIQYAQSDEVARGYAKGAAAWLNDERWTHDYRPPARPGENGQRHQQKASYLDKIQDAGARASEIVKARLAAESFEPWGEQGQIQPPGAPLRLAAGKGPLPDGNREDVPDGSDGPLCADT